MSVLEDAARAYVAARARLEGATGPAVLERAVELDAAWHDLHLACGVPWADCGCEPEPDLEPEPEARTGRPITSTGPL